MQINKPMNYTYTTYWTPATRSLFMNGEKLKNNENETILTIPLPGYGKENVHVEVIKDSLIVTAEKGDKSFTEEYKGVEDYKDVEASYVDGELIIKLIKKDEDKPRIIAVN